MKSRGKKFEQVIKEAFEKVPNISIDRIPDQMTRFKGSTNICDYIVFLEPHLYFIECKCVYGHTFSLSNLAETQFDGLLKKSKIYGIKAGVIIWFIDHDKTIYVPIKVIKDYKESGKKSVRWDDSDTRIIDIYGKKKRVYFDYDMEKFLISVRRWG